MKEEKALLYFYSNVKTFVNILILFVFIQKKIEENDKGLWHASIIDSYLIDYYIPFLPLERDHIRNCIRAEFRNYNLTNSNYLTHAANTAARVVKYSITDYDIEQIVDDHVYEPPGYKKYSSSGCKRVPFLVRTFISRKNFKVTDEF